MPRIALLFLALLVATAASGLAERRDGGVTGADGSRKVPPGMVLVPGGEFIMGSGAYYEDEKPAHRVRLDPFYIDTHEVTNAEFAAFVEATGHVTAAEREGKCWAYFEGGTDWVEAEGTDWRHPRGPGSTIEGLMDHPAVCVTWEDAAAFAAWAGKRLPTEAEWEYAARAGSPGHFIARTGAGGHGHEHRAVPGYIESAADRSPSSKSHAAGHHRQTTEDVGTEIEVAANVWEGEWPVYNRQADGFFYTAPVGSFAANDAGVHDMLGNVWEWTADWYDASYYAVSPADNPRGPGSGDRRVARGGSWFCSPNYCGAYSTHYRGASPPGHAFNNVGFRCAGDIPAGDRQGAGK